MILKLFFYILDLFYKRTRLGEPVPKDCPLLFVANHPNGLVDPILIAKTADRPIKMLAKEPIFRMPIIGWLTKKSGGIPVYRKQDGHDTGSNSGTFDAVYAELAKGGAVLIFPEGISHNLPNLQKLKTGAARMALGAEALAGIPMGTKIVPVGIVYRDKASFRSSLAVEVGKAIDVQPFVEAWKQDERGAANELTKKIAAELKKVTLELEAWEDLPLLQFTEDLLQGIEKTNDRKHRVQRLRELADIGQKKAKEDPEQLQNLRMRLTRFKNRIESLGLSARDLDSNYSIKNIIFFLARNILALTIGLIATLIGVTFWIIPWGISKIIIKLISPNEDIIATAKFFAGCLFFPPWVLGFHNYLYPLSLIEIFGLFICGVYARHFWTRRNNAFREIKGFTLSMSRAKLKSKLKEERNRLVQLLQSVAS